jgi:hypothetical protein
MELYFTPTTIFITTVSGFLVGAVWFSPVLFMKAWLQGEGITKEQVSKRSTTYTLQVNAYSFVAHGALAAVLAVMFDVLAISSLTLALTIGLLLTLGFVATTRFIEMVYTPQGKHYDARSQIKFLVHTGYYMAVVSVMSIVLFALTHS